MQVAHITRSAALTFLLGMSLPMGCQFNEWLFDDPAPLMFSSTYVPVSGEDWIGHDVDELITSVGPPDSVLEAVPRYTPFPGGRHVLSYIYFESPTGNACIDTWVVDESSGVIVKYYCR